MSRPARPSAILAREQIKSSSMSGSESDLSGSGDGGSSGGSSVEGSKSPKSLIESMDRYLDKSQDGAVDRRTTPWISTIRGPAARLESLRTVPKAAISKNKKKAPERSRKRSISDSENQSFSSSASSEEDSVLSDSSSGGDFTRSRNKKSHVKRSAAQATRSSGRLRELSEKPRYTAESSDSEEVSDGSPPRKWQPPKVRSSQAASVLVAPASKKKADYEDLSSSEESVEISDQETDVEEVEDLIVEKILARRHAQGKEGAWEYLVKWRGRSYLHCEWIGGSELQRDTEKDKRSVKLKNFNSKHHSGETISRFDKGYYYNPQFETIEKIIAYRGGETENNEEFLVKWTSLPYGESTWEAAPDLDRGQFEVALSDFKKVNAPERCEVRMQTDSRKSGGRVSAGGDPTVDFALCLKAVAGTSMVSVSSGGSSCPPENVPLEYEYVPRIGKALNSPGEPAFRVFDFQKEGISWLLYNWSQGRGCLLADEMGLGKTVQTSVTMAQMKAFADLHNIGELTMLIIAPLSTIEQWRREIKKWTDLEPVIYHGNRRDRNVIRKYEFNRVVIEKKSGGEIFFRKNGSMMPKFNVLITTFETISAEPEFFNSSEFVWSVLIVDEAHKLKASEGKARNSVLSIPCRHRILLTGTPIQNNVTELWNLLHLCSPSVWNDLDGFQKEFGNLKSVELTQKLQSKIQPFLLQRRKADVLAHLMPAKEETIVSVELTKLQKETYRAVYEKNFSLLAATDEKGKKTGPALTNVHMELRKCCNHPFLVQGVEDRVTASLKSDYAKIMDSLVNASGKMVFLDKLLVKLQLEKSKILIFSQFTMMLDLIEDFLRYKGMAFERLDGAVKSQQRQESIDRFNKDVSASGDESSSFVFLLSTKAGGVGLNLTAANYVLLFDHDWNPQNDLQAQARCHRIGQKKEVMIFRLVTRGTYEEKMFQVASQKLGLEQAVMSSGGAASASSGTNSNSKLSKEDMDRLLKEGAYAMLEDDENEAKFCAENVDEILKTRARTVSTFVQNGSGFSKARFQVNEEGSDLDVNDPNFWTKMASSNSVFAPKLESKKEQEGVFLDYSQRKGRAKFSNSDVSGVKSQDGDDDELLSDFIDEEDEDDEDDEEVDDERSRGNRVKKQQHNQKINEKDGRRDKLTILRGKRMKILFRFVNAFGVVQNKEVFDDKFNKMCNNSDEFSSLLPGIPAYADHLLLVISLYTMARQGASKLDEVFFCPTVRAAMGLLVQFTSTGTTPQASSEPILLDSLFPDLIFPVERIELSIPTAIVPQPPPKFVTEAIPRNRNSKKILLEIDFFNEIRFLISKPNLIKKPIETNNKAAPPLSSLFHTWTKQDDVELLKLVLDFGKEEFGKIFAEKNKSKFPEEIDLVVWAQSRLEKIIPKFTLVRTCQLTFALASFGFHPSLLDKAMRATGYPWTRKFVCGESCLEMLNSVNVVTNLLTPVTEIPVPAPITDEATFNRFILSNLPLDSPFSYIDVADYGKALLYHTISLLGKKSDKHDLAVKAVCKISKTNEALFEEVQGLYPQRDLSRIEAFKLMWRFQVVHFLRQPPPGLLQEHQDTILMTKTFMPIALSFGLDRWELVTNLNRHIKPVECFQSMLKFVCQNLIELDQIRTAGPPLATAPEASLKKRPSPPASEASSSFGGESAPKSMKQLTEYFASSNAPPQDRIPKYE